MENNVGNNYSQYLQRELEDVIADFITEDGFIRGPTIPRNSGSVPLVESTSNAVNGYEPSQIIRILNDLNSNELLYQNNIRQILNLLEPLEREQLEPIQLTTRVRERLEPIQLPPRVRVRMPRNSFSHTRQPSIATPESLFSVFLYGQENNNVPLSQTQITNLTRTINYVNMSGQTDTRCPITWEEFTVNEEVTQIIPCGHIFKSAGLMRWFTLCTSCPVCRYNLSTHVEPVNETSVDL